MLEETNSRGDKPKRRQPLVGDISLNNPRGFVKSIFNWLNIFIKLGLKLGVQVLIKMLLSYNGNIPYYITVIVIFFNLRKNELFKSLKLFQHMNAYTYF